MLVAVLQRFSIGQQLLRQSDLLDISDLKLLRALHLFVHDLLYVLHLLQPVPQGHVRKVEFLVDFVGVLGGGPNHVLLVALDQILVLFQMDAHDLIVIIFEQHFLH